MRKQIIHQKTQNEFSSHQHWLDLEHIARAEITSEDPTHPLEGALIPGTELGWRAAQPGEQFIRFFFDEPLELKHIHLVFAEDSEERTQEFVLRWSADEGQSYQEIVRQQYHFSPASTTQEVEDYKVDLSKVTVLELKIIPDISGKNIHASLEQLYLA